MKPFMIVALAMLAGAQAAPQQKPPAAGAPKDFVLPAAKHFTLANGLPVTMVPFGQVPKAAIRLVVSAGNVYENKDEVWLADLTGNLMREGTATETADTVARAFAGMGGELGISVGPDTTSISTEVLSERAADAVRKLADVAQRPRLPESEIERVKGNLLRNLAIQKSSPQALAQEKFAQVLYGEHPYGRVFPSEAMLKAYTLNQVQEFYRNHFGAARARLYVAGVFDSASLETAIRQAFEGWTGAKAADLPAVPPASGRKFALLDRADAPQSTVMVGLRVPTASHKDWIALEVTDALLGGAFGSRITTNIRELKGYTYSPYSQLESHPAQADWVETADVTTNVTGASLKEIFFEIDRLRKEAPSATELRGIQNNLAGVFVVQNASRTGVIGRLAFVDLHKLGPDYLSTYVKRVMAVTPDEVRRVANEYLTPDKMSLVVVGDEKTVKAQVTQWSQ
ncbi:MAG: M16 family metallopeptidase [Vicinamibacterales bacterium]